MLLLFFVVEVGIEVHQHVVILFFFFILFQFLEFSVNLVHNFNIVEQLKGERSAEEQSEKICAHSHRFFVEDLKGSHISLKSAFQGVVDKPTYNHGKDVGVNDALSLHSRVV
jgi:hypothetical protein